MPQLNQQPWMKSDVKVRDFNNDMCTNHRPAFESCDNNIMKKKAMAQKQSKNNKIFISLHQNLMYLETIKTDKTYIN